MTLSPTLFPALLLVAGLALTLSLTGCAGDARDAPYGSDGEAWAERAAAHAAFDTAGRIAPDTPPHPVGATRSSSSASQFSASQSFAARADVRGGSAAPQSGSVDRPVRAERRAPSSTDYILYTAPEQIFTVEVPASWQVQTYVDRSHPDGTIPWTGYASPDGQIVIRSPDALPGKFMMPNPYVGRYEGQRSGIFAVRGLIPAEQYATEHAQRVAQQIQCVGGRVVDRKRQPEAAQKVRASMPQVVRASISQIHAGETVVECQYGETTLHIFAGAVLFVMDHVQGWMASTSSMIAPASRADEARRVGDHIDATTTMNRAWAEREFREGQRRAAEASRKAWQAQQRQRQLAAATRSASSTGTGASSDDGGHRAFIHSIHGTQDLTDRFGDTVYGVESHSTYHWQDGQGNIVGTDIDSNPNPLEYERMTPAGGGF